MFTNVTTEQKSYLIVESKQIADEDAIILQMFLRSMKYIGLSLSLDSVILTSEVGFKGQILKLCRCKYIFFIELSTKTYLTGVCYDQSDTVGELRVR